MSDQESRDATPGVGSAAPDPLAKMRHDLRTPINQIVGYSELLADEAEDRGLEAMKSDLMKIAKAAQRMLKLLEEAFANPDVLQTMSATAALRSAAGSSAMTAGVPIAADDEGEGFRAPLAENERARLLVADDDELNRDMLTRRLRAHGYEVESAEDGLATLQAIDSSSFDLLLLDVVMPRMNGIEALKVLRTKRGLAELPIIMATAMDESDTIVEALRLGANDYVTKPLDFPVVLARVKTQLSLKRAKDAVERLAESLEIRNRFIRSTFGRYLSDEIVARLLETPEGLKLGGEKRTVTVMMSDLRGFTSMSESLAPEQVVRLLNNYLGTMSDIIQRHQGTIDEFIGDAILAIFGAPVVREDDAQRAIACAIEMQLAMESVNEFNRRENLPELQMGIGLNTGEVVVGNIGSEARAKYGVVGSQVNLTSRIESYTVGGQVLIAEATLTHGGPDVVVGEMTEIAAKGVARVVKAYDLRGMGGRFSVTLPDRIETFHRLEPPIDVRLSIIEGKSITADSHPARIVGLSHESGELETDQLAALTNIRFQLQVDGNTFDVYAKVTRQRENGALGVVVRFTAVPAPVAVVFRKLIAGH